MYSDYDGSLNVSAENSKPGQNNNSHSEE